MIRRASVLAACAALLLAVAPLRAEEGPALDPGVDPRDYIRAGEGVLSALKALHDAFSDGAETPAIEALLTPDFAGEVRGWERREVPSSVSGVRLERKHPGEPLGRGRAAAAAFWRGLRDRFGALDEALFKLVLVDRLSADGRVEVRFRYEVVGWAEDARTTVTERGVLRGEWRPETPDAEDSRYLLARFEPLEGDAVTGPGDLFEERATVRGVEVFGHEDPRYVPPDDTLRYQVIRHAVGGASAGDLDGDGYDDVLLTTGREVHLLLNRGDGTFRDVTAASGLGEVVHANAALIVDFDGDGDADVYLARFYGANLLFRNDGPGPDGVPRLVDVTAASGLAEDDMTAVLAAADFDGDGVLDLYLGRFLDARVEVPDMILYTRNGAPNKLYLGRGDLTFRDATAGSGADDEGLTLGIAAADYDQDGDIDLYLTNDYGRNVFLRNRGDGTFEDVALSNGALAISGGMSSSFGDYDNDGLLDIYVSSIRSNQRWFSQDVNVRAYVLNIVQSQRRERLQELFLDLRRHLGDAWDQVGNISLAGNYLLRQRPDRDFEDVSDAAGVRPQGWFWSSGFFDVDNDGHLDIYAVDGWVTGKLTDDL